MVQTRHSPAGFAPLAAPLETPKLDGLAKYYEQLTQQDGIALPYKERNSPSKRRKSPGHDIVFQIQFLYFQDPDSLEKVLEEFRLRSPTLHNNDDKLSHLFERLSIAVNSIKKSGTSHSSRRQLQATPSPERPGLQQATSMGLSISAPKTKDTPTSMSPPDSVSKSKDTPTSSRWPPRLLQSTQVEKEEKVKPPDSPTLSIKTVRKMSLDKIAQYPQLPPPMEPLKVFAGITSANTSFTTNTSANTSFSSDAHSSQNSLASSQTSIDSLPCMDGANDGPNVDCTQTTFYGSSISESSVQAVTINVENRVTQETYYGSSIPDKIQDQVPMGGNEGLAMLQPLPQSKSYSTLEVSNATVAKGPPRPSTPPKATESEPVQAPDVTPKRSPTKRMPEHFRVKKIPSDGLGSGSVYSPSIGGLSLSLQWECARVVQACNFPVTELNSAYWPRNFRSLHDMALRTNPSFQPRTDSDYEGSSLSLKLRWTDSKDKTGPLFVPLVMAPKHEVLNSWQRKYGADRFLFIEVDPLNKAPEHLGLSGQADNIQSRFLEMLAEPQKFLGRTWLQFHAQQKKSNKKSANADAARSGVMQYIFVALISDDGTLPLLGLRDIIGWAIPFASNMDKSWCKMISRLDLRASRAVQVLSLRPEDVQFLEKDMFATEDSPDGRFNDPKLAAGFAENEKFKKDTVMNDGCSIATPYLFRLIEQEYDIKCAFAVAQFRLAGSKGVMSRDRFNAAQDYNPDVRPPGPLIHIYPSQLKLRPGKNLAAEQYDKDYWALYIVKVSHPIQPSFLYMDFLPILIDRGVPADAIVDLATRSAKLETEEFLEAIQDPGKIRDWIRRQSAAMEDRRRDSEIGTLAGFPRARMERAIQMIEAGFEATQFKPLADDIENEVKAIFDYKKRSFRITLPQSANVIGIADPSGTLEPGEIYFASSEGFVDPITGLKSPYLVANVLVARSPSSRPSDIQKVRAVFRPELSHLYDVVVFSAKGPRPLADKLSGGDYDGDMFWICWEPSLVAPFKNAPAPQELPEPSSLGIEVDERKLQEIVQDPESEEQIRRFVQMGTANRLKPSLLGMATKTLGRVTHLEGLHSKRAVRLMDLKDLIMDSDKNGRTFDFESWDAFKKANDLSNLPMPAHYKYTNASGEDQLSNIQYKDKDSNNIIDKVFFDVLEKTFDAALEEGHKVLRKASSCDQELGAWYEDKLREAEPDEVIGNQLRELREKLQSLHKVWAQHVRRWSAAKKIDKQWMWDTAVLTCRREYEAILPVHHADHSSTKGWVSRIANELTPWDRIKASALAALWHEKKLWFHIAGNELCQLKTEWSTQRRVLTMSAYKLLGPRKPPKRKVDALDNDGEREADADIVEATEEQDVTMGAEI